jgi:lipopolysaccharide biosynthesis regulator YciM
MALLKNASGQTEQAVADLERVERQDPDWLDPHVQLAALYYKVHRPADGLRERQIVARMSEKK